MKASICDKCFGESKFVQGERRVGFTHNQRFDLCIEHSEEIDKFKTPEELADYVYSRETIEIDELHKVYKGRIVAK